MFTLEEKATILRKERARLRDDELSFTFIQPFEQFEETFQVRENLKKFLLTNDEIKLHRRHWINQPWDDQLKQKEMLARHNAAKLIQAIGTRLSV